MKNNLNFCCIIFLVFLLQNHIATNSKMRSIVKYEPISIKFGNTIQHFWAELSLNTDIKRGFIGTKSQLRKQLCIGTMEINGSIVCIFNRLRTCTLRKKLINIPSCQLDVWTDGHRYIYFKSDSWLINSLKGRSYNQQFYVKPTTSIQIHILLFLTL